jgi:hypothetical protein
MAPLYLRKTASRIILTHPKPVAGIIGLEVGAMGLHREGITSCFECAAIEHCYRTKQPTITREEGRCRASRCDSLRKGRVVETVQVVGRERGLSRRKAEHLVEAAKAVWVAQKTIQLLEG